MQFNDKLSSDFDPEVEFLGACANGKRLKILEAIIDREVDVNSLAELTSSSQSAVSQHLRKLRESGLVASRKSGQMVYYTCKSLAVKKLLVLLHDEVGLGSN